MGERNQAALESLREAGDELLALHRLEVPATLHVSLLSTNLIEGPLRNMRRKLERGEPVVGRDGSGVEVAGV